LSRSPVPVIDKGGLAVVDEDSHYTKLYPRSRVHVACDGSGDESEPEGGQTPRQSSLTGSLEVGAPGKPSSLHSFPFNVALQTVIV